MIGRCAPHGKRGPCIDCVSEECDRLMVENLKMLDVLEEIASKSHSMDWSEISTIAYKALGR